MKKSALLSVCIPVYNGMPYIGEAIDSVRSQSSPDLEVCVADNHSTDGTMELCLSYKCDESRYFRTDKLVPAMANWNNVLKMAGGEWIIVLGHDDLLQEGAIDVLQNAVKGFPANRIVISPPLYIDSKGNPIGTRRGALNCYKSIESIPRDEFLDVLMDGMVCPPTGVFFHRTLVDEYGGFSPTLRGCGDWEFLIRIAAGSDVTILPTPLTCYRIHPTQDSNSFVLGDHNDPELMQQRMLEFAHLNDRQRARMMSNMTMSLYRSLTRVILAEKFTLEQILEKRRSIENRLAAWQSNPDVSAFIKHPRPTTLQNRFVWEISRYPLALQLIRPMLRWRYEQIVK